MRGLRRDVTANTSSWAFLVSVRQIRYCAVVAPHPLTHNPPLPAERESTQRCRLNQLQGELVAIRARVRSQGQPMAGNE